MHSCCLQYFQLHFRIGTALHVASLLLVALADAIANKKPCNTALQIYFLAYTSLFSIKSKLDTAQKAYSVNKGLFLGIFLHCGLHTWAGTKMRAIMLNYAEIFYDLRY